MSKNLTRRDFLKAGALASTAAVISGCNVNLQRTEHLESFVLPPEEGLPGENLWYASTCRQCAAGCGIIVRASEGRARKVEGNPLHPLNRGKLCARGQAALQELYDPDRLKNAVRQVGGRGYRKFEPLYWDQALETLLEGLRVEPETIAFLGGNMSTHLAWVAGRFLAALGAPPPLAYSLGDELEGRHALIQTSQRLFGVPDLPLFDVGQADVVFSFGANFLETWLSPVSYSRAYGQMRRGDLGKRGYLAQFEPRYSSTAASADEWVRVEPGSEGLVALALGKIIVDEGLAREGGVGEWYAQVEVGSMAEASGVPAETLEHLARVFAGVPRPVAIPGGTPAAQQDGQASLVAVQALNLLLGRLGQPGGVFLPPERAVEGFAPAPVGGFTDVRALIGDMRAGRVKVLLVHSANPVFELPEATGFAEALANVPLVVSFSPTIDETALHADLVLPDHTNLESWGYHVPPLADRMLVSALQPTMRPLYDTRATVDVLLAVAQAWGGALGEALPWPNEVDFLKAVTGAWRDAGTAEDDFWATWRQRGGWWAEGEARQAPTLGADLKLSLNYPRFEGDSTTYPLNLHLYPSIALFDGRGANKSWLQETPDPMTTVAWQTWVEVHPETAQGLELADDDVVRVISRAGEVQAIVYVYPGVEPGTVAMPVGQGHEDYGRYAQKRGSNPVDLLVPSADEESGALAWGATRVRIEKTGKKHSLARLENPKGVDFLRGEGH
jgi:anaerobic selenocysteine-containing dehydrogenase